MRLLRRLFLPTIVSTPLWLATLPIMFRGWSALGDWPGQWADWVFGVILTFIGLLAFGLPAASFVRRRGWSPLAKVVALLCAGAIGGGLVAILYIMLLSVGSDGVVDIESLKALPAIALFGVLPGFIVAIVWIVLNLGSLEDARETVDA